MDSFEGSSYNLRICNSTQNKLYDTFLAIKKICLSDVSLSIIKSEYANHFLRDFSLLIFKIHTLKLKEKIHQRTY